jgi:hypothetical protein
VNTRRGRGNTTPGPDETITDASMAQIEADFVKSLTTYARRPPDIGRQLRAAYGNRPPGSGRRWLDQEPEREAWADQRRREQVARGLWARAHSQVVA